MPRDKVLAARGTRKWNAKNRRLCLVWYSQDETPFCSCCDEKEYEFLVLDHTNNDGHLQKGGNRSGYKLYSWIIKSNFPEGFQVLCANCNTSKMRGGICVHKR